jgi:hypothetical protein
MRGEGRDEMPRIKTNKISRGFLYDLLMESTRDYLRDLAEHYNVRKGRNKPDTASNLVDHLSSKDIIIFFKFL